MHRLATLLLTAATAASGGLPHLLGATAPAERERGDVPGWVLVTVMTAGIVVGLAAVAGPMLTEMFQGAMAAVQVP
ncbi:hypothetical protein [Quadrisphaera sp. KR29]|uniref:hypothetical protein n=1 Tax=Quadrisphaera sp. KR29 TaxID=3461391 RepID=UPI004044F1E0